MNLKKRWLSIFVIIQPVIALAMPANVRQASRLCSGGLTTAPTLDRSYDPVHESVFARQFADGGNRVLVVDRIRNVQLLNDPFGVFAEKCANGVLKVLKNRGESNRLVHIYLVNNLPFLRRNRDKLNSILGHSPETLDIFLSVPSLEDHSPKVVFGDYKFSTADLASIETAYQTAVLLQVLRGLRIPDYDLIPEIDGQRRKEAWDEVESVLGEVLPELQGQTLFIEGHLYRVPYNRPQRHY